MSNSQMDWRERLRAPTRRLFAWAKDKPDHMLLHSNESGKYQVYAYEFATNQQRMLPQIAKASYTWLAPQGETIYYVQDQHDSEVGTLMRQAWRGGEPEAISSELPPMYVYGLQVGRDGTLYFAGAAQGCYRIYRCDAEGTRVLYEHANEAYLPFLSEDETLLAFSTSEIANNRHWQATVVDARTGKRVAQFTDGPEFAANPGQFLMSAMDIRPWSPVRGDQRLLVTSNVSGEPKPFMWNVLTNERAALANELPGEVLALGWTPDARGAIIEQIYDGRTQLYRVDADTHTLTKIPHSTGTLIALPMLLDGTLLYSHTSMSEPLTMRAFAGEHETIIMPSPIPRATTHWESVCHRTSDGSEVHGFLGMPDGKPPFPAILHVHGGPTGQVTDAYVATWQSLVEAGYLFFTINFRGSTGYGRAFQEAINGHPGELELEDMAAARQYLIERELIEPNRIMLTGGSYGGYLTLMGLTRQPELWRAGFALVPLCNFVLMYEDANQRLKGWARMLLGGTPDERREQYVKSSPISQVEHLRAPVSIIAYRSDTRTPIRQVEQFIGKLDEMDALYESEILEGGHGTRDIGQMIHHHERLLQFAERYLK